MAALLDTCYAACPPCASDLRAGLVYFLGVGFPAHYWESEACRVLDRGDFTSRMHAPKGSQPNIDGRFALLPWSYVCLLHTLRPVARHFINAGKGDTIVFAYYLGMSDAIEATRIIAHGTSSGNETVFELWSRKTPTTARVPDGMPIPVILMRVMGFTAPPVTLTGRYTPAAALEAVAGACTLALQPLALACGTSPHGDHGLLFQEHLRNGRSPVAPLALDYLRDSGQRHNLWDVPVSSERNLLMRAHLRVVEDLVCKLPASSRGHLLPDGQLSLAAAWSWLVGDSVVNRLRSKRVPLLVPRAFAVDTASVQADGQAEKAKDGCTSGLSDASTSLQSTGVPVKDTLDLTDGPALSSAAAAFLARSHLTRAGLRALVSGRRLAGSCITATLQVTSFPRRVTPGAPNITEDDIRNAFDAEARRERGGTTVDENLINVLLGELADFGWAVTKLKLDPQVCCVHAGMQYTRCQTFLYPHIPPRL